MVFTFVNKSAKGFASATRGENPCIEASRATVPDPQKGSSTNFCVRFL